jgi:hypothetical protein
MIPLATRYRHPLIEARAIHVDRMGTLDAAFERTSRSKVHQAYSARTNSRNRRGWAARRAHISPYIHICIPLGYMALHYLCTYACSTIRLYQYSPISPYLWPYTSVHAYAPIGPVRPAHSAPGGIPLWRYTASLQRVRIPTPHIVRPYNAQVYPARALYALLSA